MNYSLCQYRHIFGKERDGVHSYRDPFFDLAIVDVVMTIVGAIVISYTWKVNVIVSFVFLFVLGIILHYIFCVETTISKIIVYYIK